MSGWVMRTPDGLSAPKAFRFRLDARALARAEQMSLLRANRAELMLTIGRLRSALDDGLQWSASSPPTRFTRTQRLRSALGSGGGRHDLGG